MSVTSSAQSPKAGTDLQVTSGPAKVVRVRTLLSLLIWRHGVWLPILATLIALVAWLHLLTGHEYQGATPEQKALSDRASVLSPLALPATEPNADPAAREALWNVLTPASRATAQVRRLVAITRDGLAWQSAEFKYSQDARLSVARLQITVPTTGRYRALRGALDRALLELPNLSIDQLTFARQQAGQEVVESRLQLSIWLRDENPPSGIAESAKR